MDFVYFSVEDTGMGILSEDYSMIFERFWKDGSVFTQRYRGLGLGLALCKSLVELMGGCISVNSISGEGSTFIFSVKNDRPE
jgi:signal transduction histidine kinase